MEQIGETKMSLFDGIEDASGGNMYFLEGKYTVEIVKCFTMRSRKGADLFIVECKILESTVSARPPGVKCSWTANFAHEPTLYNVKCFAAAANGIDPDNKKEVAEEITADVLEACTADDNPLAGMTVDLQCVPVVTKAGGDFTKHIWSIAEQAD